MADGKVSFTVRRPTPTSRAPSSGAESGNNTPFRAPPLPRHLMNGGSGGTRSPLARSATNSPRPTARALLDRDSGSSDDGDGNDADERVEDELVTEFDHLGRLNEQRKKKAQDVLVIPVLPNKDWRALAKRRRGGVQYVPENAKPQTGKDGSVGGLGTRDSINSGPALAGLHVKQKTSTVTAVEMHVDGVENAVAQMEDVHAVKVEVAVEETETEDQKAIRALLAGSESGQGSAAAGGSGLFEIISPPALTERDALRQDVEELPDEATLDDYARVPVAQFGAALLRGMGWKEGTTASRNGRGAVEPWVPAARPALLGIGAKEREVPDDGSRRDKKGAPRPERRYVPVVKKEREGGETQPTTPRNDSGTSSRRRSLSPSRRGSASASASRRNSRSPSPGRRNRERRRDRDRDEGNDRDRERGGRRDRSLESTAPRRERGRDRDNDRRK